MDNQGDPRLYMAAERTFLAWLRTAVALMAFGFVIARFGFFLRSITLAGGGAAGGERGSGVSLWLGLGLIAVGVLVSVVSAVRHRRYVEAIDRGTFRSAFGSRFAFAVAAVLVLVAVGMALFLMLL